MRILRFVHIAILLGVGTMALPTPIDSTGSVSVDEPSIDHSTSRLVRRKHWDDDEKKECSCGFTTYSSQEYNDHECKDPIIYDGVWYSDNDDDNDDDGNGGGDE
ncbi:hypothetical protein PspLS_11115 [Pyricularia sp. CBS 133598]|nr:hypothetical protein PspLS_11115 [Pyricularia sp. CBS 133598]